MKKLKEHTIGNITLKLFKDMTWNEYQVKVYIDGQLKPSKTYFTDNKQDALLTFSAMLVEQTKKTGIASEVEKTAAPTRQDVMNSDSVHNLTKLILKESENKDIVDRYNDVKLALEVLKTEMNEALNINK